MNVNYFLRKLLPDIKVSNTLKKNNHGVIFNQMFRIMLDYFWNLFS